MKQIAMRFLGQPLAASALAMIFLIAGCVMITMPDEGAVLPTGTVQAEVGFRSAVRPRTFEAFLDGNNVTASFSPQPPAATRPQATFSNLASGQHTLRVSAETQQYWFLIPYWARTDDTVTFSVAAPSLAFAPSAPITLNVGGAMTVMITASQAPAAATTVNLASSSAAVTVPPTVTISGGTTTSSPVALAAQAPGASTVTASAGGFQSATLAVSVLAPDFRVEVGPTNQAVPWGDSASYTVTVTSLNGFNQAVALSATDLPAGASHAFSPASVTPPANGTASSMLTITTTAAVTAPGEARFRIAGTDPANRTRRDEADIDIQRTGGAFSGNIYPLRSGNGTCGPVSANIVAGPRVQFTSPLGVTNPAPQFGAGYDFSPNCRVGFVIPPVGQQPFVNLFNLQFDATTGANGINSPYNFPAVANEVRFSPDDSIVAIIGPGGSGTTSAFTINLYDIVRRVSSQAEFFDGSITSLLLTGDHVDVSGNHPPTGPFSFTMQLP